MGTAVNGQCYDTQLQAMQALCSTYPKWFNSTTTVLTLQCTGYTSSQLTLRLASDATQGTAYTLTPGLVACDPATFPNVRSGPWDLTITEASLISAAILGVWGVAVCWRELAAFIRGGNSGDDPK